jgi:amino acid transporter
VALVNFRGIAEGMRLNVLFTSIELTGLLLVIVVGLAAIADGGAGIDAGRALDFKGGGSVVLAIMGGAALAFFALIGFEDSVNLAEEAKHPTRDFPFALFGGLLIAGSIYLLVTLIASIAVPTGRLAASSGPLLEVVRIGPLSLPRKVFSAIALFALANGALINMLMASRLVYGMAEEGILPATLGRVHPARQTPWVAIIVTTAPAMVLAASGDLRDLADTTVLLLLLVFTAVNIAVLVLRRDRYPIATSARRPRFPVIGALASLALLTTKNPETFARAGLLIVLGLALWAVYSWLARRVRRTQAAIDA